MIAVSLGITVYADHIIDSETALKVQTSNVNDYDDWNDEVLRIYTFDDSGNPTFTKIQDTSTLTYSVESNDTINTLNHHILKGDKVFFRFYIEYKEIQNCFLTYAFIIENNDSENSIKFSTNDFNSTTAGLEYYTEDIATTVGSFYIDHTVTDGAIENQLDDEFYYKNINGYEYQGSEINELRIQLSAMGNDNYDSAEWHLKHLKLQYRIVDEIPIIISDSTYNPYTLNYLLKTNIPVVEYTLDNGENWISIVDPSKSFNIVLNEGLNELKVKDSNGKISEVYSFDANKTDEAQYKINYYREILDTNNAENNVTSGNINYSLYDTAVFSDYVGSEVSADNDSYNGFILNENLSTTSGIVQGDNSLELNLYYDRSLYDVVFENFNGSILNSQQVKYQGDAYSPAKPSRPGYTFTGWKGNFKDITRNEKVTATYKINQYTVNFVDDNEKIIKTEEVKYQGNANPPTPPARRNYTFKRWRGEYTNITQDTTIKAIYARISKKEPEENFNNSEETEVNEPQPKESPKKYIKKIIPVPKDLAPQKIITAAVVRENGRKIHIPTKVYEKDNKWYIEINSFRDSEITLISSKIEVGSVQNHWSKKAVNDMASRLIIENAENFNPEQEITRGEFANYITKALGIYIQDKENTSEFKDVKEEDKNYASIKAAVDYGIIEGYTDNTFRPNIKITREEAMIMYAKAMEISGLNEINEERIESYLDKEEISYWAYIPVRKVVGAGVFNGRTDRTIAPKDTITNAEAATAVRSLLLSSKLINEKDPSKDLSSVTFYSYSQDDIGLHCRVMTDSG